MMYERVLLQTIKFDLQVDHPYAILLKIGKILKGSKKYFYYFCFNQDFSLGYHNVIFHNVIIFDGYSWYDVEMTLLTE